MAYGNLKLLTSYTLHATESIVYTAPVSKSVEVCSFWFHNSSTATISSQLYFPVTANYVTGSSTSSLTIQRMNESFTGSLTLEVSPKVPFVLNGVSGSHGEKISMKASNSSSLNVAIYGREEI